MGSVGSVRDARQLLKVIEQSTGVIVMVRCWEGFQREYFKRRSAVIQTVLQANNNIGPVLDINEHLIDPEQLYHYPPPSIHHLFMW